MGWHYLPDVETMASDEGLVVTDRYFDYSREVTVAITHRPLFRTTALCLHCISVGCNLVRLKCTIHRAAAIKFLQMVTKYYLETTG